MNLLNIPAIAASISSILGLLGFTLYCILYLSDKHSSSHLSKEIIEALKASNINLSEASKLTPAKLKLLLASHTNISKEILNRGIAKEINNKARFLLYCSIGLFACALTFGIIWMTQPPASISYVGYVVDNISKAPVPGATIEIENRTDIKGQKTDSKGFFQVSTLPKEITLLIKHEDYKPISIRKSIVRDNDSDSFMLERLDKFQLRKLTGTVVDKDNKSVPLSNVKLFVVGDSSFVYTNEVGYFSLDVKQPNGQSFRLRAIKEGFDTYDEYISEADDNILISLKR